PNQASLADVESYETQIVKALQKKQIRVYLVTVRPYFLDAAWQASQGALSDPVKQMKIVTESLDDFEVAQRPVVSGVLDIRAHPELLRADIYDVNRLHFALWGQPLIAGAIASMMLQ
ncbi:MAG: hypothetical protein M3N19_07940, partial [Candidatus Eremiobacteraeota bacterium]|nr:hypothetical protein [Candidatus Eremiobacteraeota bacterium]